MEFRPIAMELVLILGISKPIRRYNDNWVESENETTWVYLNYLGQVSKTKMFSVIDIDSKN